MINIKEIAAYVAANNGISKAAAEGVVKDAFAFIKDTVAEGGVVNLDKFGKFEQDVRAARTGRNPATGEVMQIPEKKVVKFKVAKDFKDQVAG